MSVVIPIRIDSVALYLKLKYSNCATIRIQISLSIVVYPKNLFIIFNLSKTTLSLISCVLEKS